jgi:hypothetical protein
MFLSQEMSKKFHMFHFVTNWYCKCSYLILLPMTDSRRGVEQRDKLKMYSLMLLCFLYPSGTENE